MSDYPICPGCHAVAWPTWLVEHRPGCAWTPTDPDQWPKGAAS